MPACKAIRFQICDFGLQIGFSTGLTYFKSTGTASEKSFPFPKTQAISGRKDRVWGPMLLIVGRNINNPGTQVLVSFEIGPAPAQVKESTQQNRYVFVARLR